jgi:hypothetical protein
MDYDLFNTLQAKSKELDVSVKQLRKSGYDYAQAYTNYRIAVAEETIKLRDKKTPVTITSDLVRGMPSVAKLKAEEIIKEAIYKANQESIQAIKLQIRLLDAQLEREWSIAGKGDI